MNDLEHPESSSIDELLASAQPAFRGVLSRYYIPPQDAEDLLQDTLVAYLRKRDEVRDPRKWMIGALRNECRRFWRQRDRRPEDAVDQTLLELTADTSARSPEDQALRQRLRDVIATLDHRCRSVLQLRYRLGYNDDEIAEETGYRPSSVDKTVRRCVEALSKKLLTSPLLGRSRHD